MGLFTRKPLKTLVAEEVLRQLPEILLKLDTNSSYILVLPESLSPEQAALALAPFRNKVNFVIIHADHVKLIEVT